jgi:hypothetical protein
MNKKDLVFTLKKIAQAFFLVYIFITTGMFILAAILSIYQEVFPTIAKMFTKTEIYEFPISLIYYLLFIIILGFFLLVGTFLLSLYFMYLHYYLVLIVIFIVTTILYIVEKKHIQIPFFKNIYRAIFFIISLCTSIFILISEVL